jgi:poly(3-hydroxybutyrate) depolymerase
MTTLPPPIRGPGEAPSAFTGHVLDGTLETWRATVSSLTDYWTGVVARAATPAEVAADASRWLELVSSRRRPRWAHAHEILERSAVARLRDFSNGSSDPVVPTLVLPPQAGHDSCIVDYSSEQSQMETIRAAGLTRLYTMDWIGATPATRNAGIEDYLEVVGRAVDRIGGPVNLIGDCQGGWLAAIYAATCPDRVHTLTLAGAPIDFHAGDAVIDGYVRMLDPRDDLSFYRAIVAAGGGVLKGELMLGGFLTIKPQNEVAKQLGLLARLDDADHVERYQAFEDWFKHTQDIPGTFYLWIVEHLFRDNQLVRGELDAGGTRVDLASVDCPLYLLAGEADHITPPPQVFAMADAASTPSNAVTKRTTSGGHLGLFMGREALREAWPPMLRDVAKRSRRSTDRRPSARRARRRTPRARTPVPAP